MYETLTLPNGVRLVWEEIPYVRSVAAGIWVGVGSRWETAAESGACHFIEHMTFKGTETRTAADIARDTDAIGGQINAFTTKEFTCFYGRVLDQHLEKLADILCDMFFHSRFDEGDVQSERGVIYEEIDMYEDAPDDLVSELLLTGAYRGSPLAHPILGTKKALAPMTGAGLREFRATHYTPDRIVVALAGSLRRQEAEAFARRFAHLAPAPHRKLRPARYAPHLTVRKKRIEQNHLCFGFPGLPAESEDRYAMQYTAAILGGGMSSRLFQTLREKLGLCYSVYTFGSSFHGTGMEGIYAAVSKENEEKALRAIADQIHRLQDEGVPQDELARTREQIKSNVLMGLESTSGRMNRLGKNVLMLGRMAEPDELIERFDAVTAEDVLALARRCYDLKQASLALVGRTEPPETYRALLEQL